MVKYIRIYNDTCRDIVVEASVVYSIRISKKVSDNLEIEEPSVEDMIIRIREA